MTGANAGDDAGDAGPGGDEPAEKAEGAPLDQAPEPSPRCPVRKFIHYLGSAQTPGHVGGM